MGIRRGFAAWKPVKLRRRTKIWILLAVCLLLCGFVWTWTIEFVMPVIFPVEEAVDFEMIQDFPALINVDGLQGYLTETQMAEEITKGIRTNLSANVYIDRMGYICFTEQAHFVRCNVESDRLAGDFQFNFH